MPGAVRWHPTSTARANWRLKVWRHAATRYGKQRTSFVKSKNETESKERGKDGTNNRTISLTSEIVAPFASGRKSRSNAAVLAKRRQDGWIRPVAKRSRHGRRDTLWGLPVVRATAHGHGGIWRNTDPTDRLQVAGPTILASFVRLGHTELALWWNHSPIANGFHGSGKSTLRRSLQQRAHSERNCNRHRCLQIHTRSCKKEGKHFGKQAAGSTRPVQNTLRQFATSNSCNP